MAIVADEQGRPVCEFCGDVADHFPRSGYRCPNCLGCDNCDRAANEGCDCLTFGWIRGTTQTELPTAQEWRIAKAVIDDVNLRGLLGIQFYEAELDQLVFMAVRRALAD